jgi:hypothetical protein
MDKVTCIGYNMDHSMGTVDDYMPPLYILLNLHYTSWNRTNVNEHLFPSFVNIKEDTDDQGVT